MCYEVTDRNGKDGAARGIAENVRFIKRCIAEKNPLLGTLALVLFLTIIAASFGIHASFTVSDETLATCVKELNTLKSSNPTLPVGFHIHLAEGIHDEEHSMAQYGKRTAYRYFKYFDLFITLFRLRDAGILGTNTIVGHGVWLDEGEMDVLKATDTSLVTNPESNMNNAVGVPGVLKMLEKGTILLTQIANCTGILVGLGTDGMTYDMLQEYKCNYLIHKFNSKDPRVAGMETFQMLTVNNSKLASKFFSKPVGKIQPGGQAKCFF